MIILSQKDWERMNSFRQHMCVHTYVHMYVCMYVFTVSECVYVRKRESCHNEHLEVKEQPSGLVLSLHHMGPGYQTQVTGLGNKSFFLQSHLTGLKIIFSNRRSSGHLIFTNKRMKLRPYLSMCTKLI